MKISFNSTSVNRISRSRIEGWNNKIFFQLLSSVRCYSSESDHEETGAPVADLDQGDDGDSGEESEGSSDGRDHVEDAGPELEGDAGDDRGVVVKVEDRDVATKSFSGEVEV